MNFDVKRVYVNKKQGFNTEELNLLANFKENLKLEGLTNLKILNRYDVSNISELDFMKAVDKVFSEPNQDDIFIEQINLSYDKIFAVEYLPGQYDQRADFAAQCIQIITGKEKPPVKYARVILLYGELTQDDLEKIKKYYINPVDSREADLVKPQSIDEDYPEAEDVNVIENFVDMTQKEVESFRNEMNLAMSIEDILFCQDYFKNIEKRNPTITEIRVIDTYWSDHCRHTTFLTVIEDVIFDEGKISKEIENTYKEYLKTRNNLYKNKAKDISLMDLATIGAKEIKAQGLLNDLEESDEINACSIVIDVDVEGSKEEWLLLFKNETHNHPTEIEPFGGAATCLGGAIRDPLSGRAYVYQGMRVTGSSDIRQNVEETLLGKLPQRKISTESAMGFSSYGNQIGLATGHVAEIYHPDYVAKRMEVGAVLGAVKRENIKREKPETGDVVILLGGRTGRDGIGGATGSSKEHSEESILLCGSEVQKGNAPTERKIQRLFRNENVSSLIKKCNDFGAGGVAVAIGELADGLVINLDYVLKKYNGLDGTELAISESQERMAVVVAKEDAQKFIEYAQQENLESKIVAEVTDNRRLVMNWREKKVLDISRDFLDTNGIKQRVNAFVKEPEFNTDNIKDFANLKDKWIDNLSSLNVASQKGMVERFDSTIGAGTVIMPFGGKHQLTPSEAMVAKIPVENKTTNTCSVMAYGFDPYLSKQSPYHGAIYAVVHSVAKIVAAGGDHKKIRLSFQEYFEKLNKEPQKWGKPLSALLGAYKVQKELKIPSIGGKDSMSGTFKDLSVPPTLISFAVTTSDARIIISPEIKNTGNKIILVKIKKDSNNIPDFKDIEEKYQKIHEHILKGDILSAQTVGYGGISAAISKMCLGNEIGFKANDNLKSLDLFLSSYGDMLLETKQDFQSDLVDSIYIGDTTKEKQIIVEHDTNISLEEIKKSWIDTFNSIYPIKKDIDKTIENYSYKNGTKICYAKTKIAKPRVFIPVFPGTNCEYDTKRAFEKAGAEATTFVFKNNTNKDIQDSIKEMEKIIRSSQIIAFPGGFSAGDEPEGSGKFIAAVFRNPSLMDATMDLIKNKDGLIIGICNGFQALIKLGLLPFGEIVDIQEDYPTLTYNKIGRHISTFTRTKVVSNLSPWLAGCNVEDIYSIPVSHGEGRFSCNEKWLSKLKENGQIATQYVDFKGDASYDGLYNPNGSVEAIEGITSSDGRIIGKMGHSERIGNNLYKNIPGEKDQHLFESGVNYFR